MHNDLAIDAIQFDFKEDYKTPYKIEKNKSIELAKCQYFTTNIIELDKTTEKDIYALDSFVIYMCLEGEIQIKYNHNEVIKVTTGETILIPANLYNYTLVPSSDVAKVLEVYIEKEE